MYKEIKKCRISESKKLINILSLGNQSMTGVFPKSKNEKVFAGPVDLVWCPDSGLLQMKQSYSLDEMYGDNYGYRSGLNQSMVKHLKNKINFLENLVSLDNDDLVIDIGSNDATSLKSYSGKHTKVGIDPTGKKFSKYYTDDITLIPDFFSETVFKKNFPEKKAKIITSIAMFYDLEDPVFFVEQIYNCLDDDGIWHFEQSYMPSMLKTNSYDTICHEHLEFYSLEVVNDILSRCDLKIIDVQMNSINGGSFAVTASKKKSSYKCNNAIISWLLKQEKNMGLDTLKPYKAFSERVFNHKKNLLDLIHSINKSGKKIFGYGASTKGNVLLQYCGLTSDDIQYIAEVNEEKFGCYTPGSNIPIISEQEAKKMNPDYFLVLPWHFKNNILQREQDFISNGGKFIFPLPEIEII
tara:strand:+ start:27730 stop:28959 length:1230 start_codon:yes stop_codon:yes gene_type:complete